MQRIRSICAIAALMGQLVHAQTRIDLSTQARMVDFSAAASTKPFKSGLVLPPVCSTGEVYFLLSAIPGLNIYTCVATNTWSVQGGLLPGGDVQSGSQTTVTGIHGRPVADVKPSGGQVLSWNESENRWEPSFGKSGVTVQTQGVAAGYRGTQNFVGGTGSIVGAYDSGSAIVIQHDVNTAVVQTRANAQTGRDLLVSITQVTQSDYKGKMMPVLSSYTDGMTVQFRPPQNCGAWPTLSIDGLGAKRLYEANGVTDLACVAGRQYAIWYDAAADNSTGAWRNLSAGATTGSSTGNTTDGQILYNNKGSVAGMNSSGTGNLVRTDGAGLNRPILNEASIGSGYLSGSYIAGPNGVTAGTLVSLNSSGQVVTSPAGSNTSIGVVVQTAAAGSPVEVATSGVISCVADNVSVQSHLVVAGSATAGTCRDAGVTSITGIPASVGVIGRWLQAVTTGGTGYVLLFGPGHFGANAAPATTGTAVLKADGTGGITNAAPRVDYAPATTGTAILKADGTGGFANAAVRVDYAPATSGTAVLKADGTGGFANAAVRVDYAPATSGTAVLKADGKGGFANAAARVDYAPATSGTAVLKADGAGGFTNAAARVDYAPATSGTAVLKADGAGGFTNAAPGTDYVAPTAGTALQKANGSGGLAAAVAGTDYAVSGTVLLSTPGTSVWTAPAGVNRIFLTLCGGGGSGASGNPNAASGAGGGGGGCNQVQLSVTPEASYNYTVGAGGAAPGAINTAGSAGGASSFGPVNGYTILVRGGNGGGVGMGGSASGAAFGMAGVTGGNVNTTTSIMAGRLDQGSPGGAGFTTQGNGGNVTSGACMGGGGGAYSTGSTYATGGQPNNTPVVFYPDSGIPGANGGGANSTTASNGQDGTRCAGGGGGGANNAGVAGLGGRGGDGYIRISW